MEYGFCVAGEPLVREKKRATAVRPPKGRTHEHLLPVQEGESGDLEAKDESDGCGAESEEVHLEPQEKHLSNSRQSGRATNPSGRTTGDRKRPKDPTTTNDQSSNPTNQRTVGKTPDYTYPLRTLVPTLRGGQGGETKPLKQEAKITYCERY